MKCPWRIAAIVCLVLSGCRPRETGSDRILKLRLAEDPSTLDPAFIVDVPGGALSAKIYNGLVRFDSDGKVVPDLASSWEISPDGKKYRFHLREGVKFHNGRPLEAQDAVYSWSRLLDPAVASPRDWLLQGVKGARDFQEGKTREISGIRTEAPRTVAVELEEPSPLFLSMLAMPNASIVPREEVEKWGRSFADHPSGTGPFLLREWKHGERIELAANPEYYRGSPKIAGVLYRVIPEDLTAAVEFEGGNLDLLEIPRAEFRKYTTREPWKERVRDRVGLNVYYLGFNCQTAPYSDPRFRRALNLALDRKKIIATILEGRAVAAAGPVPPELLPSSPPAYPYDPEEAKRLLKECGIPLPFPARLILKADREVLTIAEVIQDYFRRVGVELVLVQREWSAFKEAVNTGDFDLFYLSWWGDYPAAENFLYPTFHSSQWGAGGNRARFQDPAVDLVLDRARRETSPEESRRLFSEAEERVVESAPWVFLWHKKEYFVFSPRVRNYRIPVIYNGDRFEEIELVNGE
ncbi:MAG: ABC transporter substrate-binding protein [Candidatus Aureabacteria bacterium]|nr:ABC transporter substrate-binding protein [Candidatus Auribacterota bacterium]